MSVTQKKPFPSSIGKLTTLLALLCDYEYGEEIEKQLKKNGYRYAIGRVGAMDMAKVIAAIETAAKVNRVIDDKYYREVHALYHATLEAIQGVGRGTTQVGDILRTVGLTFAVVRGPLSAHQKEEGEWICVSMFGTIGAPKKGYEHEVLGFSINHI